MTGINFVMDDKGEKTGLLIDLKQLKSDKTSENDVMEYLEDILAIELNNKENEYSDWEEAKKRLKDKGIID